MIPKGFFSFESFDRVCGRCGKRLGAHYGHTPLCETNPDSPTFAWDGTFKGVNGGIYHRANETVVNNEDPNQAFKHRKKRRLL